MTKHQKINNYLISIFYLLGILSLILLLRNLYHLEKHQKDLKTVTEKEILCISNHMQDKIDYFYQALINDKNRLINKTQTNIQKTYFELLNLLNEKINQFLTENDKQELIQLIKDKITNFGSFNAKEWFASWFKKGDS